MNVVETAQSLVRVPSVNPGYDPESRGEADMADWLMAWAREHAVEAFLQEVTPERKNVIMRFRNGADRPHLLLNGHMDTVAVEAMTVPPFEGILRDERLWGRGAADMKGPLACMLHTLLDLQKDPASWQGTITLACVVDEEVGFSGIRRFLELDSAFDFAIVGEPTRFEVVRGCKGLLRFAVRAHGKSAHSSTPELGANAIGAMAQAILAMNAYFANSLTKIQHPSLGCSTGSVGVITGGSGINIVPEFCEAKVDVRLVPGQSWQDTYAEIQQMVNRDIAGIRWEFDSTPFSDASFCLTETHPMVLAVCTAVERDASQVVNFSCDASKIAAAGIPCLIFGPGDIANAHTANESIAIADLERGVAAYVRIARRLLSRP